MNVILYKNGRIRFSPWILFRERSPEPLRLHNWLTPRGLILPLTGYATTLKLHLMGKLEIPHTLRGDQICVLIEPSGLVSTVEISKCKFEDDPEKLRLFHYYHMTEDNYWMSIQRYSLSQYTLPLLEMDMPLEQVMHVLDQCESQFTEAYQEWDYNELVAWVAKEVKERFEVKTTCPANEAAMKPKRSRKRPHAKP